MKKDSYLPRHITPLLKEQLHQMDIVAITGARKTGKTTLSRQIAQECKMSYVSLDQEHIYTQALRDSEHFIKNLPQTGAVIDEFQKVPKLVSALKWFASEKQLPQRLLITGSAHLFTDKTTPLYRLAGNIATVDLHPFSQGEIEGHSLPSDFIHRAFEDDLPSYQEGKYCEDLASRAIRGGYPHCVLASNSQSRQKSNKNYINISISNREFIPEKLVLSYSKNILNVLENLSLLSGKLLNPSSIGSKLKLNNKEIEEIIILLEQMFVVNRVYNWDVNHYKIYKKMPKLYFSDTGLLSYLNKIHSIESTKYHRRKGSLFENFAFTELSRINSFYDNDAFDLYFYRPSPGKKSSDTEIDFVLIRESDSSVIGIEVKSAAKTQPKDFKGLRHLKERIGERFKCGVVLYTGNIIRRVDERLYAVPINMLWDTI